MSQISRKQPLRTLSQLNDFCSIRADRGLNLGTRMMGVVAVAKVLLWKWKDSKWGAWHLGASIQTKRMKNEILKTPCTLHLAPRSSKGIPSLCSVSADLHVNVNKDCAFKLQAQEVSSPSQLTCPNHLNATHGWDCRR